MNKTLISKLKEEKKNITDLESDDFFNKQDERFFQGVVKGLKIAIRLADIDSK